MKSGEGIKMQGFARVRIREDGKVVGDSGWTGPNLITQVGLAEFVGEVLIATAGSQLIQQAQLGTGGAPATNTARLVGSIADGGSDSYVAVSKSTITTSDGTAVTARFYGTFNSSDGFITDTDGYNISNIGLYSATTSNASLACGQAYASSDCQSNQDVEFTYEWRFATA